MKYMIGYQLQESGALVQQILKFKEQVHEVYFSWGTMASGRGSTAHHTQQMPFDAIQLQKQQLTQLSRQGIGMNLLLNANCYGADSLSRQFLLQTGDLIAYLQDTVGLSSVTTTSPVLAHFIKANFQQIETRASVNMEIGTVEGMTYLADDFDSFYCKRELNRNLPQIARMKRWADDHNKKLYMLANSGCLNYCSARQFHDNLVAHETQIKSRDNGAEFISACSRFVSGEGNRPQLLRHLNCVRPEEMYLFEPYVAAAKLATRVSPRPEAIVRAYMLGQYRGNLLDLLEPNHAAYFHPTILDNSKLPADYCAYVASCDKTCESCSYCKDAQEQASIRLNDGGILDVNQCND